MNYEILSTIIINSHRIYQADNSVTSRRSQCRGHDGGRCNTIGNNFNINRWHGEIYKEGGILKKCKMRWDCEICGKNKNNRKFVRSNVNALIGRGSICKKCVRKMDARDSYGQYVIRMRDGPNGNVEYLVKWADEESI